MLAGGPTGRPHGRTRKPPSYSAAAAAASAKQQQSKDGTGLVVCSRASLRRASCFKSLRGWILDAVLVVAEAIFGRKPAVDAARGYPCTPSLPGPPAPPPIISGNHSSPGSVGCTTGLVKRPSFWWSPKRRSGSASESHCMQRLLMVVQARGGVPGPEAATGDRFKPPPHVTVPKMQEQEDSTVLARVSGQSPF